MPDAVKRVLSVVLRPAVYGIGLALLAVFWIAVMRSIPDSPPVATSVQGLQVIGAAVLGVLYGAFEDFRRGARRNSL